MNATAALTEVDPAAWDDLIAQLGCDDAYLRRGYLESAAVLEGGEPTFLRLAAPGGDVVFAVLLRRDPADVISPYGYGGPVGVGAEPPFAEFWDGYAAWCADRGVVSSFFRFHPRFENQTSAGAVVALERLGDTIDWRLDEPADLYEAMHSDHRRLVRKAREAALDVRIEATPADLDAFVQLYETTMARKGADSFYFFTPAYWHALAACEGLVVAGTYAGTELVSSAVFLSSKPWLHYHLSASNDEGLALGANRLMLLETAQWAKEREFTHLHLGGGVGAESPSLFRFKKRFYPAGETEFWIGKAVHDPDRYKALSGTDEIELDGFFPAYRAAERGGG